MTAAEMLSMISAGSFFENVFGIFQHDPKNENAMFIRRANRHLK